MRLRGGAWRLSVRCGLAIGLLVVCEAGLADEAARAGVPMARFTAPPAESKLDLDGKTTPERSVRPALDEGARALIDAEYLTPEERRSLRIRHGVYESADIAAAPDRARAALRAGAWDDASLDDPATLPEDRAEARILRGELADALTILDTLNTPRALALRIHALVMLGRVEEAKKQVEALGVLLGTGVKDSPGLVWAARGLADATSLFPASDAEARSADFKSIMSLLFSAREQADKLDPAPHLAEARLLWEKDNFAQAGEAVQAAIALNPRWADVYALLGEIAVAQFDFARTELLAGELRKLRGEFDVAVGKTTGGVAPLAELVTARMRLRQRDPEAALAACQKILDVLPNQPDALAYRAAAQGAMYREQELTADLARFDSLFPGSAVALVRVGQTLSEMRQYDLAEKYLVFATQREPGNSAAWSELGLMRLQNGKDFPARDALRTANALDPFNIRVENSLKLISELLSYTTFESEHFIVRCKPGVDEVLAKEMLGPLEKIYARVTGDGPGGMRHKPDGKTMIELLPDHHWFSVRITGMPQLHTIAAATGPVIAMEAPRAGPGHKAGPYDWARVIQHEFTHTVSLSRAKNRMPHWFTEAAAVYLEDSPRDFSAAQILARAVETGTLFDFEPLNIAFVRPERPTDRGQAYAQGAWMYEYMIEAFGPKSPLDLLDRYAMGQTEAEAFPEVLGISREEFMARFREYAKAQLSEWGMRPKPGQPTLTELLSQHAAEHPDQADAEPTREMVAGWLEAYPDHPQLLTLMLALELQARNGTPAPEMVPLLKRTAAARPVDPQPRKLLADLALRARQASSGQPALPEGLSTAEYIENLEWLDAREQNSPAYAAELAQLYVETGDLERAERKAERATQLAPYDSRQRELAARVALTRRDFVAAERHIRALIALEPDRPIHTQRLESLLKLKNKP